MVPTGASSRKAVRSRYALGVPEVERTGRRRRPPTAVSPTAVRRRVGRPQGHLRTSVGRGQPGRLTTSRADRPGPWGRPTGHCREAEWGTCRRRHGTRRGDGEPSSCEPQGDLREARPNLGRPGPGQRNPRPSSRETAPLGCSPASAASSVAEHRLSHRSRQVWVGLSGPRRAQVASPCREYRSETDFSSASARPVAGNAPVEQASRGRIASDFVGLLSLMERCTAASVQPSTANPSASPAADPRATNCPVR